MKILVDNADLKEIKKIYEVYPVDGVLQSYHFEKDWTQSI